MKPSIVFVGEESVGLRFLKSLHARGADLRRVLSDGPVGRLAASFGYDVDPADRVTDPEFAGEITGVDLLLNVHSLHIVADRILDSPRIGAFNVHPGPLPEYAGLNTPSWAIYEGAEEYGVTVHRMASDIDAGSIAFESRWDLDGNETGLGLWTRCSEEAGGLLERLLDTVARGEEVPSRRQDLDRRRYYGRGPPREGRVTWEEDAAVIERFARACEFGPFDSPWGRPTARIGDGEIEILEAVPTDSPATSEPGSFEPLGEGRYRVATADRWVEVTGRPRD